MNTLTCPLERRVRMSIYLALQIGLLDEIGFVNLNPWERRLADYLDTWLYQTSGWPGGSDAKRERDRMLEAYRELEIIPEEVEDDR
jgi:hypothetical protein